MVVCSVPLTITLTHTHTHTNTHIYTAPYICVCACVCVCVCVRVCVCDLLCVWHFMVQVLPVYTVRKVRTASFSSASLVCTVTHASTSGHTCETSKCRVQGLFGCPNTQGVTSTVIHSTFTDWVRKLRMQVACPKQTCSCFLIELRTTKKFVAQEASKATSTAAPPAACPNTVIDTNTHTP